jgi:hypothetical protein
LSSLHLDEIHYLNRIQIVMPMFEQIFLSVYFETNLFHLSRFSDKLKNMKTCCESFSLGVFWTENYGERKNNLYETYSQE